MQEQESWAQQEVGHAQLGHAARTNRLVHLVEDLVAHPTESVPQACEEWASTKGAYRFWNNAHVQPAAIRQAHIDQTLLRCQPHEMILAIQDTTDLDYSTHPSTTGLGHLQGKRTKGTLPQGLKVHSVLAVSPAGVPFGLLYQHVWVREEDTLPKEEKVHRRMQTIEQKESGRWLQAQRAIEEALPESQRVLTVADREADLYDLFAQPRPEGKDLLIRAKHDRVMIPASKPAPKTPATHLWESIRKAPVAAVIAFEVPRSHDQPARKTTVALRFATLTMAPPPPKKRHAIWKPLPIQVILVEERDPPEGVTPVRWLLLTTLPISSVEEAVQAVLWYRLRWLIERYHYVLKSGCHVQDLQLETRERLERALATYCVVAWRILWLTTHARDEPTASCEQVFERDEWQALYASVHQTLLLPEQPPNLQEAVFLLARLGGFLGRKHDGEPGAKVLWRGMRRLHDIVQTWRLLHSQAPLSTFG